MVRRGRSHTFRWAGIRLTLAASHGLWRARSAARLSFIVTTGLGGRADTVRALFDKFGQGDAAARTTIDDVARILLLALLAVRAVFDPELIVLGGSIGMRAELVSRTRDLAQRYAPGSLRIECSALGSRAAVVGAVGMALTKLYAGLFGSGLRDGRFQLPNTPTRASILEQRA